MRYDILTSVSFNADKLRDAASRKIDHIALLYIIRQRASVYSRCRSIAHTRTVMLKLHLVALLSKFATNPQQIVPMELQPYSV